MEIKSLLAQDKDGEGSGLVVPVLDTSQYKDLHLYDVEKDFFRLDLNNLELKRSYRFYQKDTQVPRSNDPSENVADEVIHKELGDSLVRASTTASSLEAEQDSGNINKTQSKATPNESSSLGTTLSGGLRCQETIEDTTAQTRFESVSKHSNNSLLARGNTLQNDEDRLILDELMALCTTLQKKVLDLEKIKTTKDNEIASLKRRVKKLEKKNRLRTHKLKRLYKVGLTARVESSSDEESLGEDASKQERIDAIDADKKSILVSVKNVDEKMFDVNVLDGEEVFVAKQKVTTNKENDEVNVVAGNVISTVGDATTVSAAKTTTDNDGDITLAQTLIEMKSTKPKDKGKGIMIEPVKPMKKKDQISFYEETAKKLQAEFDEEERLARKKAEKEKAANIALIESWDDIQAKIDADHHLAERLQAQEQKELFVEEKATLFQQLLEKRRMHFAAKGAEEKRNKPPIKAQHRQIMCTCLKNMEGYKLKDLKSKGFNVIQEMFDEAFKKINTFEDFRTELVEGKEKRVGTELIQENAKKQKVEDDKETTELKQCLEIIPDEEEVAIDAIPLDVKSPSIVGWKIYKEGRKSYYQIMRADGKPVEDLDLMLWGDLKTMFEPHVEDKSAFFEDATYADLHVGREKHPLAPLTLSMMLEKKLIIDHESEMTYQLLKFIIKQLKK
ncbi:hypothetical protein Tco_0099748 [Tanacetum coccineum]